MVKSTLSFLFLFLMGVAPAISQADPVYSPMVGRLWGVAQEQGTYYLDNWEVRPLMRGMAGPYPMLFFRGTAYADKERTQKIADAHLTAWVVAIHDDGSLEERFGKRVNLLNPNREFADAMKAATQIELTRSPTQDMLKPLILDLNYVLARHFRMHPHMLGLWTNQNDSKNPTDIFAEVMRLTDTYNSGLPLSTDEEEVVLQVQGLKDGEQFGEFTSSNGQVLYKKVPILNYKNGERASQ